MTLDLDTVPLSLAFGIVFRDFCAKKKISNKNITKVFEQAVNELAHNLGLEVRIEQKIPDGLLWLRDCPPESEEHLVTF